MDGLGLVLFLVFMALGLFSGKRKKEEDRNVEVPPLPSIPPKPKQKTWDIKPQQEKSTVKSNEDEEAKIILANLVATTPPPKVYKEEWEEHKKPVAPNNSSRENKINWQQGIVLAQVLAPPKGKKYISRYSKIK